MKLIFPALAMMFLFSFLCGMCIRDAIAEHETGPKDLASFINAGRCLFTFSFGDAEDNFVATGVASVAPATGAENAAAPIQFNCYRAPGPNGSNLYLITDAENPALVNEGYEASSLKLLFAAFQIRRSADRLQEIEKRSIRNRGVLTKNAEEE